MSAPLVVLWLHADRDRYTGFHADQVGYLRDEHHVYLQENGRLSIAYAQLLVLACRELLMQITYKGLNPSNLAHVAQSIDALVRQTVKNDNILHPSTAPKNKIEKQSKVKVH